MHQLMATRQNLSPDGIMDSDAVPKGQTPSVPDNLGKAAVSAGGASEGEQPGHTEPSAEGTASAARAEVKPPKRIFGQGGPAEPTPILRPPTVPIS